MKAADVISTLSARGVELWQEGGTLRYRARAGTLTEQERATLRAHKARHHSKQLPASAV